MGSEPLTVARWFAVQSSRADASARGGRGLGHFWLGGGRNARGYLRSRNAWCRSLGFEIRDALFQLLNALKQNPDLLSLIGRRTLCPGGTRRKNHQYCKDRQSSAHGSLLYCFLVHSS